MVLPVGTDQYARRTPYATMALVAANVACYLAMLSVRAARGDEALEGLLDNLALVPGSFRLWQLITYQFLHDPGSLMHLLGNMFFLWTFGAAVESRMGRWRFLAFYLAGGIAAGLAQLWLSDAAVIGASGAVAAVTGAFIVLFPRARVVVFMLMALVPMPAMLLVGLYFLLDLLGAFGFRGDAIAFLAHLGGTVFGFAVAWAMLATGAIKRNDLDLPYLARQWRRRAQMRASLERGTGGPWMPVQVAPEVRAPRGAEPPLAGPSESDLRAAKSLREQANTAYQAGDFGRALERYELSLLRQPEGADADQARLMIAVICVRRLPDRARAVKTLDAIRGALAPELQALAQALRQEAGA
ncbi:MAG: rhomboid family intramembrane serine protease [Phycisphaerales bacterium]